MPVAIVVGGQFGSEGKGKVALELRRRAAEDAVTLVRVGGPNSGHTAYSREGRKHALRQLPAGCIDRDVDVVFPAGSYIDLPILNSEIAELDYPVDRIFVSQYAQIITDDHKIWEARAGLIQAIGSTGSGVGAAVLARVAREAPSVPLKSLEAQEAQSWAAFPGRVCDTTDLLREKISRGERVLIEGSQGFGLSLLDGGHWPKATARTTTAAGALAEAGLSPRDVDDVTLVLRSYPIRVAGDSGPLVEETTWEAIARRAGRSDDLREFTSVSKKLRRVGQFDPQIARKAIAANNPNRVVLNHLDYVGTKADLLNNNNDLVKFLSRVENSLGRSVDWYGFSGLDIDIARAAREAA